MVRVLKEYALKNNVPIMQDEGLLFLLDLIKEKNVKTILEIGTAIGYSSINFCINKDIKVTTIERDENLYQEALNNIKKHNLDKQIKVILGDALDVVIEDKFDLIFIDAAKAQYTKFFNRFKDNLNNNGYIVTDNLKFHGLVGSDKSKMSHNLKGLITKIEKYIDFLKENEEFITEFVGVGDGLSVSTRRKENGS
jgi:predicted O-methyltransferase YrrM